MTDKQIRYPYEEEKAGELRSDHFTGKASERLLADEQIISLAKEVLSKQEYLEAEELAKKLAGKKVERVFGRMKNHRRLNNITVRRRRKVTIHSLIPVIVTQAMALAFPDTPRNCVT